ncbi:meprin A subunit beta-like [Eucyclogobius newberryi]|uniref:meprin A subunit beta-like n=1 Tax=Eucyclogobius newberryi TaxID=166745 RepID=UPI003B5B417C
MSISEINKGNNDIQQPLNSPQKSAIVDKEKMWKSPMDYTLDNSLALNTKGIVLRAFDWFRLKSCIDFKPWDKTEEYYVDVVNGPGCASLVGKQSKNGQKLILGDGCEQVGIVEHEFLHALGFYHEHQRFDRDSYVTINFTNVMEGKENNFDKLGKTMFTTHGTVYDYWSVMHYGPFAFSIGNGSTIIAKNPGYMNIIGQTFGMSKRDVLEMNLLYKCGMLFFILILYL